MPNPANVDAPVVLVSPGRSGTTLLSAVFDDHPDCSSCGETADLIFDLWNTGARSLAHLTPEVGQGDVPSADDRIAQFVRQGMLLLLRDDKPHWFQKPIGIPAAFSPFLFDCDTWDDRAEKYWSVMRRTFPRGRFFTVLRHPCDTVISYKNRFDVNERTSWAMLGFLAHILAHRDSLVGHAVFFDRLVEDRESALRELMTFAGLPFDSRVLSAFDTLHTESASRGSSRGSDFSWEQRWQQLDARHAKACFVEPIRRLFAAHGRDLALPFAAGGSAGDPMPPDTSGAGTPVDAAAGEVEQMRLYVAKLETRLANLDATWEERALRVENEFNESYRRLEAKLNELTVLRRNPIVRLMRKSGLMAVTDRLWAPHR